MKKWYCACLTVVFLLIVTPLFAQVADLDDENMILFVADMSAQDPPDNSATTQGQPQTSAGTHQEMKDHHGWGMGGHGHSGGVAAFLNISKEQIARMKDLHTRYYAETRNLRYDLMQQRLEMRRLFLDPKADSAALMAKQKELSAVRQRLMDVMARMMIDWRAILTPEQIQKLDMAALAHGMMGMGGGMMGMGGGMMGMGGPGMMGHGMEGHGMMGHGMEGHGMMGHGMDDGK